MGKLCILTALLLAIYYLGGQMTGKSLPTSETDVVSASVWKNLAAKRIYFGHQSVGYNILDGMKDIMGANGQTNLNVCNTVPTNDTSTTPIFAHSDIGKNGDPYSKIDDFARKMAAISSAGVDLALFKFCYVDFDNTTDIGRLFGHYKSTMSRLKQLYPKTTLIHVTVPLVSMNMGAKDWIKKIIGRSIKDPAANVRRNQFNDLLRKEFVGKEPIFDLAETETGSSHTKKALFRYEGKVYRSMNPEYTDDGGHLNRVGRRIVAQQFLVYLASSKK